MRRIHDGVVPAAAWPAAALGPLLTAMRSGRRISPARSSTVAVRLVRERFGQAEFERIVEEWSEVGLQGPVWISESTQGPPAPP